MDPCCSERPGGGGGGEQANPTGPDRPGGMPSAIPNLLLLVFKQSNERVGVVWLQVSFSRRFGNYSYVHALLALVLQTYRFPSVARKALYAVMHLLLLNATTSNFFAKF